MNHEERFTTRRTFLKNTGRIASASALAGIAIPHVHAAEDSKAAGAGGFPTPKHGGIASSATQAAQEVKLLHLEDSHHDPRTVDVYRMLTTAPNQKLTAEDEAGHEAGVQIDATWSLHIPAEMPKMAKVAGRDLQRFLHDELGVALAVSDAQVRHKISARIDPKRWHDPKVSKRAHAIVVGDAEIAIVGASEWGVACGFYHLQRLLKLRKTPRIPLGTIDAAPTLEPSLTFPAFKRSFMADLDYPVAYNDEYLCRIARAGYTGFHLDLDYLLFVRSNVLPELNRADADQQLEMLRQIVARSRRHALEVYITLYATMHPENHPVFLRHPEVRGSRIIAIPGVRILCSSAELTRRFYNELVARLFIGAPGLAGLFLIIGGEGLLHCYTAPDFRPHNQTSCPRCGKSEPETVVAALVNGITSAVKQVNATADVVVWSYNAFTWTQTPDAGRLISLLSPDCAWMTDFDMGERVEREGVPSVSEDYSLGVVGPGERYLAESEMARRRGMKFFAKVESGSPREMNSVPMVPALPRWGRKYRGILESGAAGAMFLWEFVGYTGSLSAELAGWMSWRPAVPEDKLLAAMAARDFAAKNAFSVLKAWRHFDRAMDHYPVSGSVITFLCGPFSIGFAQPLLMDARDNSDRRYFGDLSWTHPFGADKCLLTLRKMEEQWQQGVAMLDSLQPPDPADAYVAGKISEHQSLSRGILCMIRTAINLVRFYCVRDEYFREVSSLAQARKRLVELREIAKEEMANADTGLQCMRHNLLLGNDYVNGADGFTEKMVLDKIAHTKQLIDFAIPYRMFVHSFHMHSRDEWIWDDGRKWR